MYGCNCVPLYFMYNVKLVISQVINFYIIFSFRSKLFQPFSSVGHFQLCPVFPLRAATFLLVSFPSFSVFDFGFSWKLWCAPGLFFSRGLRFRMSSRVIPTSCRCCSASITSDLGLNKEPVLLNQISISI